MNVYSEQLIKCFWLSGKYQWNKLKNELETWFDQQAKSGCNHVDENIMLVTQ